MEGSPSSLVPSHTLSPAAPDRSVLCATDLSAHRSSWEELGLQNKQLKYGEIRTLGAEIRSKGWGTLGEAGGGTHFK